MLAVAVAEVRTARRLVRTWVFATLAIGTTVALFWFYAWVEGTYSPSLPGRFPTRFLAGHFGVYLFTTVLIGAALLAFDARSRHEVARIVEPLDSRPYSNVSMVVGGVAGLTFTVWLSVLVALALVQVLGAIARALDWWMGNTLEPVSLLTLGLVDAMPTVLLWISFVTLLGVVVRSRLVVALTVLAILGVLVWWLPRIPVYLLAALVPVSDYASMASDLAPRIPNIEAWLHRGVMLVFAAGFIVLAAAFHPRFDGGRRLARLTCGIALNVAGLVGVALLVGRALADVELRETWLAVHTEAAAEEAHTLADVEEIRGDVVIEPGFSVLVDVTLKLRAPRPLKSLVFSFNPGMRVTTVRVDDVGADFTHHNGLLTVDLTTPMAAGSRAAMSVRASGIPDPRFGYLDAAVDPWRVSAGNRLNATGREASIFEGSYVGLMPAIHWLPAAGANVYREDPARRPGDLFAVELAVDVPDDWLVAAVGRRRQTDDGSFRFRSTAPVPAFGLFASRFVPHVVEAGGVQFELLLHPRHLRNIELFSGVGDAIREHLQETLTAMENLGIGYPYDAYSAVEVPTRLRRYGGGWLMDSQMSPPGLFLIGEHAFPMVRFERPYLRGVSVDTADIDPATRLRWLQNVGFNSDVQQALSRQLLAATGAAGEGALALDFVCRELAYNLLIGETPQYVEMIHSAHNLDQSTTAGSAFAMMLVFLAGDRPSFFGHSQPFVERPDVWEHALELPLSRLDRHGDAKTAARALGLKGTRIAHAILDGFDRNEIGAFLAALRDEYAGRSYRWEDFVRVGEESGVSTLSLLGDWLHAAESPGFAASNATVVRLSDDHAGKPRYQTRVHVRNSSSVTGAVAVGMDREGWTERIGAFPVGPHTSVEIGMVSPAPPPQLWLHSYFSLNRAPLRLDLPANVNHHAGESASFVGVRASDWLPPTIDGIVVDDLDPGFAVEVDGDLGYGDGILGRFRPELRLDRGLPQFWWHLEGKLDGAWFRHEVPSSWGVYRHTTARAVSGTGNRRAVFAADLPTAGRWQLHFHVPYDPVPQYPGASYVAPSFVDRLGRYQMWLRTDGRERPIEFDGSAAAQGWNRLGEFHLDAGLVDVVVSNRASGDIVIADAIRWLEVPASN